MRRRLVKPRYEVEKIRKSAKQPLLSVGKKLDAEAQRITFALLEIEEPIDAQIKEQEQRIERERLAKAEAERQRIQGIQSRIEAIRGAVVAVANSPSALILEHIADIDRIGIDASFAEFAQQASDTKAATIARLKDLHAAALEREAERDRIAAERAELARRRAEDAERTRLENERLAQERAEHERLAALERERQVAAARQHAEELRREREAVERDAAENRRIAAERQAQLDRTAEQQRAESAAEAGRLAAERADIERQQAALAEANKPKPVLSKSVQKRLRAQMPSRAAIVACVAERFEVSDLIAAAWLKSIDWDQATA